MNMDSPVIDLDETNALEIAAPVRGKSTFSSPLDQVKNGFYSIILQAHSTFRVAMVASLLNETGLQEVNSLEDFDASSMQDATGFNILSLAEPVAMQRLREEMAFKPGNGADKPFEINFIEDFYNVKTEVVQKILGYMPKDLTKGMPLDKFIEAINSFGIQNSVNGALEKNTETLKEKYIDTLDDVVQFVVRVERKVFNENNKTDSLVFHFSIRFDGSIYKEVVQSDKFHPYLLYIWVRNSMGGIDRSGRLVIDPTIAVNHNREMTKFSTVRPKVNANGFALHGSGLPIFIPPSVNVVDKFLSAADSAMNTDGEYTADGFATEMIEKQQFANKFIYVDWINDILAYTSATGIMQTVNLGQVHPLDKATEWGMLSTSISAPALKSVMAILSASISELESADADKYIESVSAKQILHGNSSSDIYLKVIRIGSGDNLERVQIKHLAGYDLDKDFAESVNVIPWINALRALIRLLYENSKNDADAIKLTSSYKNHGLLYRIIGLEYVIQTCALTKTTQYIDSCYEDWKSERNKAMLDNTKTTFEVPNMKVGPGGIVGFLPHQGRILSSTEKTPRLMALPVGTGGGKTILSGVTAIKMIENMRSIPMITTKGNLVKGTITEMNAVTGGKMNIIPFTPAVIRAMKKLAGIKTFAEFLKWYRALPLNTILVNSYSNYASRRKLFDDLDTVTGFCDAPTYTTQYLLIIKLLGIKGFIGDESHIIKNPDSARSRNSYTAFSQADVRAIMSGTMVSNTVVDLVGQARALSPYIFGDDAKTFGDNYGVSTGLIKSDDDARVIKDRLRNTVAYHEAHREDWSYMLPLKDDVIQFADLTALQKEFYDLLMQEALALITESEKRKGKKVKLETDDDDEGDDADDDDEDEDDDDAEEEDEDGAFIQKAKTYLQKVEMFLVAPDENEQYVNFRGTPGVTSYTSSPQGEDLISPKVRLADQLIAKHLAAHRDNPAHNKIIIFGYNKVATVHFMRHSKFSRAALHYTAGDIEAIRRYENDDNALIIAADEGSIREGLNWQMTSLILRLQSVWAPGDHEQALARMFRPDPRGKYNRERVAHIWLMAGLPGGEPSLDAVKMARLVSKSISNARLTFEGRMEWRQVSKEFDEMILLKMNLQRIFFSTKQDIDPYLGNWDTFVNWENQLNSTAKRRLAEQLEAQFNITLTKDGKILDINQFIKLAMKGVTSTTEIPGSRRVWVPWTAGAIPADPKGWGFTVLGQQPIAVGTVVYTEFGPAVVENVLKKGVKVRLYDGRIVGMRKNIVMLVNKDRYAAIVEVVKNPTLWQAEAFDVNGTKTVPVKTNVDEEEVINSLDDDEEDTGEMLDLDVVATIVNGWPALMVLQDIKQLKGISEWKRVDPFVSVSFRSWTDVDAFLKLLDSKVTIPNAIYDALEEEIQEFKSGKALVLGKQITAGSVRDFFAAQHKGVTKDKAGKIVARPYFIAVEREIKLAFDINSHEARLISWIMKSKEKIAGVKKVTKNGAIWVNTFTTVREAYDDLASLENIANVDKRRLKSELVEIKDEIQMLRKPRSKPSV